MSKDFNISMICLILNWFVYDPSWMLHLSEFVRKLRSSVLVVFNNFLLRDATARSKISGDQKRFFIALSLYPLSFFANTPFNICQISVYEMSCLRNVLSIKYPVYEMSCLWNVLSMNCPVYEMSCLRNLRL